MADERIRCQHAENVFACGQGWCLPNVNELHILVSNFAAKDMSHWLSAAGFSRVESDYWIIWGAPASMSRFDLKYSTDSGRTWNTIENNVTGTEYMWTFPTVARNRGKLKLKVVGYEGGARRGLVRPIPDSAIADVGHRPAA